MSYKDQIKAILNGRLDQVISLSGTYYNPETREVIRISEDTPAKITRYLLRDGEQPPENSKPVYLFEKLRDNTNTELIEGISSIVIMNGDGTINKIIRTGAPDIKNPTQREREYYRDGNKTTIDFKDAQ